ncbi:MAG: sigma-54-dependent transcriptional regulator [Paraglaciecola sp.]|jgi:sigma-54-dependent transcriptional regulator
MLSSSENTVQGMEDLIKLTTLLASERDIDRLFNKIVEFACKLTGAEVGRIFILDISKRFLHQSVSQNRQVKTQKSGIRPVELFRNGRRNMQDVSAYCAFTGKVLNIADIYQFSGFELQNYYDYDRANNYHTTSLVVVPFRNHLDETIGVLQLSNLRHTKNNKLIPFPVEMEKILLAFASQAAVTLNNVQLIEQNEGLIGLMNDTNRQLAAENQQLRERISSSKKFAEIIGQSKPMQKVFDLMTKVIDTAATVLLTGETGTGKELVANAIHCNGERSKGNFVAQNCATLPENLLEGELFGYRKGAFSGADRDKKGLIEHANGGTLFLDEIGDMPIGLQAKLLRVVQEREVRPLGALNNIPVDIRIVAATHHNLQQKIKSGEFREDLFYRLSVFPIELPALRERKEDIPPLIDYFLRQYASQYTKNVNYVSPAAMEQIMSYPFPGNIREMRNTLERAVLMCEDHGSILPEHLPQEIQEAQIKRDEMVLALCESGSLRVIAGRYEASVICRRLMEFGGNQTKTAESLQLSRRALINKIEKYAIRTGATASESNVEQLGEGADNTNKFRRMND